MQESLIEQASTQHPDTVFSSAIRLYGKTYFQINTSCTPFEGRNGDLEILKSDDGVNFSTRSVVHIDNHGLESELVIKNFDSEYIKVKYTSESGNGGEITVNLEF